MKKISKKMNITEIARRANVSIATVSRAINNPEKVRKETLQLIQNEIEKSNYMKNSLGLQLRTNKTYTIGLIHTSLEMNFYSQIAQGIEETARKQHYNLILCNSADDPEIEEKQLQILFEKQVDGIIIAPTKYNLELIKKIQLNGVPVCCIDRIYTGLKSDHVLVDNKISTYEATTKLIAKGYRHIGFISAPTSLFTGAQRLEGFTSALRDNGLQIDEDYIQFGDTFIDSGYTTTIKLIQNPEIDCIFCANELMALGSLKALNDNNILIPTQMGFLTWDNPPWAQFSNPQISVIAQPTYEMGAIAAETIIRRITSEIHTYEEPLEITLHAKMIDRSSLC
ncbi:MAG: LacI family DNA-binding transcriptional regulator [Sphaerochaeta sp.]|nr:LacI family DNA-binding transcriptional regulator [Sphaerochaeta sp.]